MKTITFAHRGGSADRPPDSVEAFRAARDRGARGLESDVRLSADGVPVLDHDGTVRAGLRKRRVEELSAADLAGHGIVPLEALYEVAGPDLEVSLDLQTQAAAGPVLEVARERGDLSKLWLCSPDLGVLRAVRAQDGDVRLVHATRRRAITVNLERHAADLSEAGLDAMSLHRADCSKGLVVLFHRFGLRSFVWDVQEVRHLREVLLWGVDGLYCDHVDRMVAVVSEFEG